HALHLHADRPHHGAGARHHLHVRRSAHRFRDATRMSTQATPLPRSRAPLLGWQVTPLTRRRLANFRANRRGFWSLWIFLALFVVSLFAEFIANDHPLVVDYEG